MSQKGMSTIGAVVAVVLAFMGLVAVGFFILMGIALSSWGSNK
jgi:hypothetical protein